MLCLGEDAELGGQAATANETHERQWGPPVNPRGWCRTCLRALLELSCPSQLVWKPKSIPRRLSQPASTSAFLSWPWHRQLCQTHCHPHRLYQLWANLTQARDRTGMIKLLLVLLLLFLSLFMSPSWFCHSCYWRDTQWECRKVIWDPDGVILRLKSTGRKAVSACCRNT